MLRRSLAVLSTHAQLRKNLPQSRSISLDRSKTLANETATIAPIRDSKRTFAFDSIAKPNGFGDIAKYYSKPVYSALFLRQRPVASDLQQLEEELRLAQRPSISCGPR